MREDYSPHGTAWDYFSHDQARSRAYRWGEDGLAGICDNHQRLCFAVGLWNGRDPILKERAFGLTGKEGNHGEDVKEYYFYLDNIPSHAYMKYLYKYPQQAYPYNQLVQENSRRGLQDFEFELLDAGVFDEGRYFDIFVEYGKVSAEDILIKITIANRGAEKAGLHLLPTLWFRKTWSWAVDAARPSLARISSDDGCHASINPNKTGTKASAYYTLGIESGKTAFESVRHSVHVQISCGSTLRLRCGQAAFFP